MAAQRQRLPSRLLLVVAIAGIGWLGFTVAGGYQAAQLRPTVIVVLGGGIPREILAARLSNALDGLPVIVSSGTVLPCLYRIFVQDHGVPWDRVTVDYRATDTFSNFTAVSPLLLRAGHRHVILVTSERQLPRVKTLAAIILGGQRIAFTPVTVAGGAVDESWGKTLLDGLRAFGWLVLGDLVARPFYNPTEVVVARASQYRSGCLGGEAEIPNWALPMRSAR